MKKLIGILCLTVAVLRPGIGFPQESDGLGARQDHREKEAQKESSEEQQISQAASEVSGRPQVPSAQSAPAPSNQIFQPIGDKVKNIFPSVANDCDSDAECKKNCAEGSGCKKYYDLYTRLFDGGWRYDRTKMRIFYERLNAVTCPRPNANRRDDPDGCRVRHSTAENEEGLAPLLSQKEWYQKYMNNWENMYRNHEIERNAFLVGYQRTAQVYDNLMSEEMSSSQLKDRLNKNVSELFRGSLAGQSVKIRAGDAIMIYLGEDKLKSLVAREQALRGKETDKTVKKSLEEKGKTAKRELDNLARNFQIPGDVENKLQLNAAQRPDFMASAEPVAAVAAPVAPAVQSAQFRSGYPKGVQTVSQNSAILGSINQKLDKPNAVPAPNAGGEKAKTEPKGRTQARSRPTLSTANLTKKVGEDGPWKCAEDHWCTEQVNSKGEVQEIDWRDKNDPDAGGGAYLKVFGDGKLIPSPKNSGKAVYTLEAGTFFAYKAPGQPLLFYQVMGPGLEISKAGPVVNKDGKASFVSRLKGEGHLPNLRFVAHPKFSETAPEKQDAVGSSAPPGPGVGTADGSAEKVQQLKKDILTPLHLQVPAGDSKSAADSNERGNAPLANDNSLIISQPTPDGHVNIQYPRWKKRGGKSEDRVTLWKWDGNENGGNAEQIVWGGRGWFRSGTSTAVIEKGAEGIINIEIFLNRKNVEASTVVLTRSNGSKEKHNLLRGDLSPDNETPTDDQLMGQ